MKKLLLILGGVIISLSVAGNSTKCLYAKAVAYPSGAGTVYMHGRLKRGDNPEETAERKCIWDRTGGTGPEKVDDGWAGEAYIKAVRGENGQMPGIDCTGTLGRYEFILNNRPADGYEFVCYADTFKTDANAVYTPTECYALIHGEGANGRVEDFNYNAPESNYGSLNLDNMGNHFINGNVDDNIAGKNTNDDPETVFGQITPENQDEYFPANPHRTIYAIFRPVGDEYPKFVDYVAHFINFPNWGVYAYAWTGEAPNETKLLGDYPGTAVDFAGGFADVYNQEYYTKTVRFATAPEYIIFNNGITGNGEEKCGDMTFINGGYYAWDRDGGNISKFVFLETDKAFQIENDTPIQGMSVCYPRQFTLGQKSTVCLPFALSAEQAAAAGKFYMLTDQRSTNLRFEEVTNGTVANTPYIFVPNATGYPFENLTIATLPANTVLNEVAVTGGAKMISTLETTEINNDATWTYFGYTSSGVWRKVGTGGATLRPFRACIAVPTSSLSAEAKENPNFSFTSTFDDATGISSLTPSPSPKGEESKYAYDLSGRRVSPSVKGVKIVNGKKYINK